MMRQRPAEMNHLNLAFHATRYLVEWVVLVTAGVCFWIWTQNQLRPLLGDEPGAISLLLASLIPVGIFAVFARVPSDPRNPLEEETDEEWLSQRQWAARETTEYENRLS